MAHHLEIDGYNYYSAGSIGKCEKPFCDEKGLYFDENGSYLCEDHLVQNHENGLYDDDYTEEEE